MNFKHHCMLWASVAALGMSAPAFAQLKARDIAGVKLGMSIDEVRAAMKAHDPAMQVIDMATWNAKPGVPASLAKIRGCNSPKGGAPTEDSSCKDVIEVTIGQMSKKAIFVTRVLKTGDTVIYQNAIDSLIGKYGTPTYRGSGMQEGSMYWSYAPDGKPITSNECGISTASSIENVTLRPQCAVSVGAYVERGVGALASAIRLTLLETQRVADEREQFGAARKAYQDEVERNAKGSKIKL